MFAQLLKVSGITASEARFDRRTVAQAICEATGKRCSGDAIENLADRFLAHDDVVALALEPGHRPRLGDPARDGRAVVVPLGQSFTTRQ